MCVKVPIGQTKNNLIPANIFYYNVAEGKNGSEKKINWLTKCGALISYMCTT